MHDLNTAQAVIRAWRHNSSFFKAVNYTLQTADNHAYGVECFFLIKSHTDTHAGN
jgi:hypothetical protein